MSLSFPFTDAEVDSVALRLGVNVSDAERRKVLLHGESCVVQAGPGTGKTTLLATKLAMLTERWTASDHGICVLSHTNIARTEVERQLTKSTSLQRLLEYPHFIGTIQTFADQFLALPYLRHQKIEVTAVDNDRFTAVARKLFLQPEFNSLRGYLQNRTQRNADRVADIISGLRYSGPKLVVTSANGNLGLTQTTSASYVQAKLLKDAVSKRGIFRYDDMFAFAELAAHHCPYLIGLIRQRFPWVFVDEVQDTNADQNRLLRALFEDGCIYVRLGDENQSIFRDQDSDDAVPSLFDAKTVLTISSSLRFGPAIAAFASPLTVVRSQTLLGRCDRPSKPHTIFVFDRCSVSRVIPEFGDLVLRVCTPEELKTGKVKVVGLRKAPLEKPARDHFPFCLPDYWKGFIPHVASLSSRPKTLLGYVMEARCLVKPNTSAKPPFESLTQGVLGLLHRQETLTPDGKRWSRTTLYRALEDASPDTLPMFQELLRQFCFESCLPSDAQWTAYVKLLMDCLKGLNLGPSTQEANDFLSYEGLTPGGIAARLPGGKVAGNMLTHNSTCGTLEIEVGTIHSAKGETHAATLVVETYSSTHDIHKLLPVLTGQENCNSLAVTARKHCKCIFVGMTRPAYLLCLAIFRDHLRNGDIAALSRRGWNIIELN
jgi:DNA helicase-2/ATP-dependent DNA helicase PcrA